MSLFEQIATGTAQPVQIIGLGLSVLCAVLAVVYRTRGGRML